MKEKQYYLHSFLSHVVIPLGMLANAIFIIIDVINLFASISILQATIYVADTLIRVVLVYIAFAITFREKKLPYYKAYFLLLLVHVVITELVNMALAQNVASALGQLTGAIIFPSIFTGYYFTKGEDIFRQEEVNKDIEERREFERNTRFLDIDRAILKASTNRERLELQLQRYSGHDKYSALKNPNWLNDFRRMYDIDSGMVGISYYDIIFCFTGDPSMIYAVRNFLEIYDKKEGRPTEKDNKKICKELISQWKKYPNKERMGSDYWGFSESSIEKRVELAEALISKNNAENSNESVDDNIYSIEKQIETPRSEDISQESKENAQMQESEKLFCRKCGKTIPIDSSFCPNCGVEVIKI